MIRIAEQLDCKAIAKIHIKSWHETYTGIVYQNILDKRSIVEKEQLWKVVLEDQNQLVIVYENNGKILGFADFYFEPNTQNGEVRALYLLKECHGQGIGRQLLEYGFAYFKKKAYRTIKLEVLNKNPSRYFYEHLGAKCIGEISAEDYGEGLKDLIYQWDI